MINHIFAACLMLAAQTYQVPPQVLVGILHVEGGRIGQQVRNTNGSFDLGPMQINTLWMPELAEHWGVPVKTAHKWVRDDGCTNVNVAAWILRGHLNETGSLAKAVAQYHSRTPHIGARYKRKVVEMMQKKGLLSRKEARAMTPPRGLDRVEAKRLTIQDIKTLSDRSKSAPKVRRLKGAEDKG